MEVIKLKKVIRFKQKPWIKNYIDEINKLGAKSAADFTKRFLKT